MRGLGNKEEIPHDLKPIDWENASLGKIHKVFYNVGICTVLGGGRRCRFGPFKIYYIIVLMTAAVLAIREKNMTSLQY